jgi:hypothetical protein
MKNIISAVTIITCIASIGCSNSSQSSATVNTTKDTIIKGDVDSLVYLADINDYKKQVNDSIIANQLRINEYNARIADEKAEDRAEDRRKIDDLNTKNSAMKRRIDEYKAEGKTKWIAFKTGFNKDMHDLGQSITNLKNKIIK